MVRNCFLLVAGFTVLTPARAGIINITGTLATADAIHCYQEGSTFATCSQSPAGGSATSVADVDAGHLGAFVSVSDNGVYVNGFAQAALGLALSDFTDTDFLEIDLSLHGTFSNGGATASLYVYNGDSTSTYQLSCGPYYEQNYGRACSSEFQQAIIPLVNVDTLGLTFLLQPALTHAPAFADFMNSMDFTIAAPNRTTIVNNPGGTLFQSPVAPVPEPSTALLIGLCLVAISPWRRILRRRGCGGIHWRPLSPSVAAPITGSSWKDWGNV